MIMGVDDDINLLRSASRPSPSLSWAMSRKAKHAAAAAKISVAGSLISDSLTSKGQTAALTQLRRWTDHHGRESRVESREGR